MKGKKGNKQERIILFISTLLLSPSHRFPIRKGVIYSPYVGIYIHTDNTDILYIVHIFFFAAAHFNVLFSTTA